MLLLNRLLFLPASKWVQLKKPLWNKKTWQHYIIQKLRQWETWLWAQEYMSVQRGSFCLHQNGNRAVSFNQKTALSFEAALTLVPSPKTANFWLTPLCVTHQQFLGSSLSLPNSCMLFNVGTNSQIYWR